MYSYTFFFLFLSAVIFIYSKINAFRFLDEHGESRNVNLDGLRAFLAFFVFYHHLIIKYHSIYTGKGPYTESVFFNTLGSIGVSLFFMITGYLFWSKVRKHNDVNWVSLFSSRAFRIGPLYLAVMAFYCLIVLFKIDFQVTSINLDNIRGQLSTLLFLGMDYKPHAFMNRSEFLGYIGPTWSLFYEWLFYLSLPVLALIANKKGVASILTCSFIFLCLINNKVDGYFFSKLFILGMLTYELKNIKIASFEKNNLIASTIVIVLFLISMFFSNGNQVYNNSSAVCLGLAFLLIVRGCSIFGILKTKGATRIGSMSYSIYLTHNMISLLMVQSHFFRSLIVKSEMNMWLCTIVAFVICLSISMFTYQFIERKGVELGRKFLTAVKNKSTPIHQQIKAP